ncbi:MAG: hypothetical protein ACRDVZ_00170, partial [Jiangellaceae bacterium]
MSGRRMRSFRSSTGVSPWRLANCAEAATQSRNRDAHEDHAADDASAERGDGPIGALSVQAGARPKLPHQRTGSPGGRCV